MRVVFFGTYDAMRHPRVRVLREGFVEHGDEVSDCNVPFALDTADRVNVLRSPPRALRQAQRLLRHWWRLWKKARDMPKQPDAIVVGYMGHFDIHLARRIWPSTPKVLDHMISLRDTADDRRVGNRAVRAALGRIDSAAVTAADIVLIDTEEHLELLLPTSVRSAGLVVPIGASSVWFHPPRAAEPGPLRVVFYGSLSPLQGVETIGKAIGLLADEPSIRFTMIGSGQDEKVMREEADANRNADWHGWIDPGSLPAVVAGHDVCLGIFGITPKAHRVVPHKVFEGAAAGCAVVTSDTPPQRRALADAAFFVPPGNPVALAEALREIARDRGLLSQLQTSAYSCAAAEFRGEHLVSSLRDRIRSAR